MLPTCQHLVLTDMKYGMYLNCTAYYTTTYPTPYHASWNIGVHYVHCASSHMQQ